jgi:chromosome segregation ATPase
MEAMAKSWTDERLEERFDAIDQRFDGMDRRFDRVEGEIRDLRGEMNARFDKMNADMKAGFERADERFEAMHRLMVQGGVVIIAALLGLIGTQL